MTTKRYRYVCFRPYRGLDTTPHTAALSDCNYDAFIKACRMKAIPCLEIPLERAITLLRASDGIGVGCYLPDPKNALREQHRRLDAKANLLRLVRILEFTVIEEPIALVAIEPIKQTPKPKQQSDKQTQRLMSQDYMNKRNI